MLRIFPLYIITCSIFTIYNMNGLLNETPSISNVISHFLFVSILNPVWWNTFPGTGCMAVLFIMWPLFLIYRKYIINFGRAIIGFSIIYLISQCMMMFSDFYCLIDDYSLWNTYISYFFRGIQSFAFTPIIFYFPKFELFMTDLKRLFSFSLIQISLVSFVLMIYSRVNINILYVFILMPILLSFNIYESKIIVNKIACFLGKYIFGIYLFHILGYFVLVKFVNNTIFLWFLNFIISITLSYFSNKFIEKPFIMFITKIWRIQ